jgi:hypothetical protein
MSFARISRPLGSIQITIPFLRYSAAIPETEPISQQTEMAIRQLGHQVRSCPSFGIRVRTLPTSFSMDQRIPKSIWFGTC